MIRILSTIGAVSPPLFFNLLDEVTEGIFGKVYKARETGGQQRLLTVKQMSFRGDWSRTGVPDVLIREMTLICKLSSGHANIVTVFYMSLVTVGRSLQLAVVLEDVDQDLTTYLSKAPASGLSRDAIKNIMQQLLKGLDFLHSKLLAHGDLKPANILVSSCGQVKIADFGLMPFYRYIVQTPAMLKLWYKAPEVLLQCVHTPSVDMWSAGCILAELFLLRPLFQGNTEVQQLQKIYTVIGFPNKEDWPKQSSIRYSSRHRPKRTDLLFQLGLHEYHLLAECLAFSPSRRISAAKALTHSFFMNQ